MSDTAIAMTVPQILEALAGFEYNILLWEGVDYNEGGALYYAWSTGLPSGECDTESKSMTLAIEKLWVRHKEEIFDCAQKRKASDE